MLRCEIFSHLPTASCGNTYSFTMTTITDTQRNWSEQKHKLIQKFPVLWEEDLRFEAGKKDEMWCKLETKLGKTKEELDTIIDAL